MRSRRVVVVDAFAVYEGVCSTVDEGGPPSCGRGGTSEIVRRVGLSKPAVTGQKRRFAAEGVAGLDDRPNGEDDGAR